MQLTPTTLAQTLLKRLDRDGDGALSPDECLVTRRPADTLALTAPRMRDAIAALDPLEREALGEAVRRQERRHLIHLAAAGALLTGLIGGMGAAAAFAIAGNFAVGAGMLVVAFGSAGLLAGRASETWAKAGEASVRKLAARLLFPA